MTRQYRGPGTATFEYWYPIFGAVGATVFAILLTPAPAAETAWLLFVSSVTFGSIIAGFVGTSLAILVGIDSQFMRDVRGTLYFRRRLKKYVSQAFASGVILACVGMTGLFFALQNQWIAAVWWGALVFCVACLVRLRLDCPECFFEQQRLTAQRRPTVYFANGSRPNHATFCPRLVCRITAIDFMIASWRDLAYFAFFPLPLAELVLCLLSSLSRIASSSKALLCVQNLYP